MARAQVVAFDPASLTRICVGAASQSERATARGDATGARALFTDYLTAWRQEQTAGKSDARDDAMDVGAVSARAFAFAYRRAATPGPERVATATGAAQHFLALSKSYPLLASYHALYGAQSLLLAGRPKDSLTQLAAVPTDSVLDCEARFLRGDALLRAAELEPKSQTLREQAVLAFRAYLSACSDDGARKLRAQVQTAQILDTLSRTAEVLQIWRRFYIEAPTESAGVLAGKRLEQPGSSSRRFRPVSFGPCAGAVR